MVALAVVLIIFAILISVFFAFVLITAPKRSSYAVSFYSEEKPMLQAKDMVVKVEGETVVPVSVLKRKKRICRKRKK